MNPFHGLMNPLSQQTGTLFIKHDSQNLLCCHPLNTCYPAAPWYSLGFVFFNGSRSKCRRSPCIPGLRIYTRFSSDSTGFCLHLVHLLLSRVYEVCLASRLVWLSVCFIFFYLSLMLSLSLWDYSFFPHFLFIVVPSPPSFIHSFTRSVVAFIC